MKTPSSTVSTVVSVANRINRTKRLLLSNATASLGKNDLAKSKKILAAITLTTVTIEKALLISTLGLFDLGM